MRLIDRMCLEFLNTHLIKDFMRCVFIEKLKNLFDYNSIDVIYPVFGNNLDFINKYSLQNQIKINYI